MRKSRQFFGLPWKVASLYLVLFCMALLFYSVVWKATPDASGDYYSYATVAKDLKGLSLSRVHLRPPGYPLLLLLTGSAEQPTKALFFSQLGLHFATIWLLALLLSRTGIGRLGLTLFASILLLPPFVEPAAYAITEVLSAFLLAAGLVASTFALARGSLILAASAGLSFGFCGATHPTFLLLAAAVVACHWVVVIAGLQSPAQWGHSLALSASLLFGWLLIDGGVILHNGLRFGYWRPSPFAGYALSTKTVKVVERLPKEFDVIRDVLVNARNVALVKENSSHTAGGYVWDAHKDLERVTGFDTKGISDLLVKANLMLIRKAPINYLSEVVHSAVGLWFPGGGTRANMNSFFLQGTWFMVQSPVVIIFWMQLPLVIGLAFLLQRGRISPPALGYSPPGPEALHFRLRGYCLAVTIVLYTTGIIAFFGLGEPRYRRPIEPLVVLVCILGVKTCMEVCFGGTSADRAKTGDGDRSSTPVGTLGQAGVPR